MEPDVISYIAAISAREKDLRAMLLQLIGTVSTQSQEQIASVLDGLTVEQMVSLALSMA